MLFLPPPPYLTYTSLIVRPGVPHHNGSFSFSPPQNYPPFMNPLGLLLPPLTTYLNDLALRCYRCHLQLSQGCRCYSILDRGLQLHDPF